MEARRRFEAEVEAAEAARKAEQARIAELMQQGRQPRQCTHCGDWSQNEYVWSINHRDDLIGPYDGKCIRHHFQHARAQWVGPGGDQARAWLTEHGFELPEQVWRWQ